jgi:hypothetical protein
MNQTNQTQLLQDYGTVVQSLVSLIATLTSALRGKAALAAVQRERMEGCRLAALKVGSSWDTRGCCEGLTTSREMWMLLSTPFSGRVSAEGR